MLLVDDIALFPLRGILWIFEEIRDAAEQELREEAKGVTSQLQQLYAQLETGGISETEFDRREAELLDRLDQLQDQGYFGD